MPELTFVLENPADPKQRPRKRQAQNRPPPNLAPPLYKASVKELTDAGINKTNPSISNIKDAILQRIKKYLQQANHENTPETKAKAALYLASRLISQHNIS
jgi:hypothetical protein